MTAQDAINDIFVTADKLIGAVNLAQGLGFTLPGGMLTASATKILGNIMDAERGKIEQEAAQQSIADELATLNQQTSVISNTGSR